MLIESLNEAGFSIKIIEDNGIFIRFSGIIDIQNSIEVLTPYFEKLNNALVENKIENIALDFSELNFLNSSGIKTLISWIMKVKSQPHKYHFNILINENLNWQKECFKVIGILGQGIVSYIK